MQLYASMFNNIYIYIVCVDTNDAVLFSSVVLMKVNSQPGPQKLPPPVTLQCQNLSQDEKEINTSRQGGHISAKLTALLWDMFESITVTTASPKKLIPPPPYRTELKD
jgi:hypothetical protein